jgi:hypothetical protein
MPRKSVKKIMKELMAKKKLTSKEKKLLVKMQKGGLFGFDFSAFFGLKKTDPAGPVDQATLAKQFDDLKGQICKVCKAAFGEEGCKCGNTAPPVEEPMSTSGNSPARELNENQPTSGDGDRIQEESMSPAEEPMGQPQPQPEKKTSGGKGKSMRRKMKRFRRMSKKMRV